MNLFLMAHDVGSLLQANKFWIAETLRKNVSHGDWHPYLWVPPDAWIYGGMVEVKMRWNILHEGLSPNYFWENIKNMIDITYLFLNVCDITIYIYVL